MAYFNIAFLYFFLTRLKFSLVTPVPGEIITISPSQSPLFHSLCQCLIQSWKLDNNLLNEREVTMFSPYEKQHTGKAVSFC